MHEGFTQSFDGAALDNIFFPDSNNDQVFEYGSINESMHRDLGIFYVENII